MVARTTDEVDLIDSEIGDQGICDVRLWSRVGGLFAESLYMERFCVAVIVTRNGLHDARPINIPLSVLEV